tara:strand:- start:1398 stop:2330 length:933 start_codon:yes stop_codon:yes gene_type:complete
MNLKKNKILILGSSGFFGYNFCRKLTQKKIKFFTLTKKQCDLLNYEKSLKKIKAINPNIIFNFAGKVGGINYNINKPAEIIFNNCKIGLNLFEISSKLKIKKLINIGSSCSYPGSGLTKLNEKNLFTGQLHPTVEAYGFWKLLTIVASKAYKKQTKLNSLNIIFPSLYGPFDKFDKINSHVISALIVKFLNCKKRNKKFIKCWGDGSPVREFLFVEDAVEALIEIVKSYNDVKPINIGMGKGYSIKKIAEIIKRLILYEGKIKWDKNMSNGAMKKILDNKKMLNQIKWRAKTDIEKGIAKTISWYSSIKK